MIAKFWPKGEGTPLNKCDHRYGAEMTYSVQTDSRFETSIYAAEWYAFKYNIRIGAFINNLLNQYDTDLKITEDTGVYRHDIYYGTDYWKNPTTGDVEVIPDYYGTVWTTEGAQFFNVTPGQSKASRTPRQGQQMYDLSNGALGMDYVTGQIGANQLNEVFGVDEVMQGWFFGIFGRYPCAGSYRNGDNGGWPTHLSKWLSFRNSTPIPTVLTTPQNTQYGSYLGSPSLPTDRDFFINYPSSSRTWDAVIGEGKPEAAVLSYERNGLLACLNSNGWYRTFIHFHSMANTNTLSFFDTLYTNFYLGVGSAFVWKCSNGEAMEYATLRDITKRLVAVTRGDKIVVVAEFEDTLGVRHDLLNTPLSVNIDLSGTFLEGKNIKSSFGKVLKKANDEYVVEIPFNYIFSSVELEEGEGGEASLLEPTITTSIEGSNVTVNTDILTKVVLFRKAIGDPDEKYLPFTRDNVFLLSRVFTLNSAYEYSIGAISELGQASLKIL